MVSMPYNQSYAVIRKSNCSLESETEFSLIVIECRPTIVVQLESSSPIGPSPQNLYASTGEEGILG